MCKIISLRNVFILWLLCLPLVGQAQSSCDKLFAEGAKWQQTMTISAQNKAIAMFEKAKVCYDSSERKNICDQQIKTSRTIIQNLRAAADNAASAKSQKEAEEEIRKDSAVVEASAPKEVRQDIKLLFAKNHLAFKAKGGEFKKVKVDCNYEDWKVTETPGWVTVSRNSENELVIETEENTTEDDRAGVVKVECGDKEATLIVNQKQYNKLEKLKNKVIK